MPRRKLTFEPDQYYHLYNRGNDRQRIFLERENYLHFLRLVRHYLVSDQIFAIVAYCLMPHHYHLLVRFRAGNVSDAMLRLGLAYTKAVNRRYDRMGSLFQGRFQASWVDRESYLQHLVRYIHLNPVKAGIVQFPAEWEFSSYLEYAGLRGGTLPEQAVIRQQFASEIDYHAFVTAMDKDPRHFANAGDLGARLVELMLDE